MHEIAKETLSGQENLPFWVILTELWFMVVNPFNEIGLGDGSQLLSALKPIFVFSCNEQLKEGKWNYKSINAPDKVDDSTGQILQLDFHWFVWKCFQLGNGRIMLGD